MSDLSPDFINFLKTVEGGEQHRDPATGLWFPYNTDGAGKWTIGRGHLINGGDSPAGFEQGLTDAEVEELFARDVENAREGIRRTLGEKRFDALDRRRQEMLVDFTFNLGSQGVVQKFPKFTSAVLQGDEEGMRREHLRFRTTPRGQKKPLEDRNKRFAERFFPPADPTQVP